MSDSKVRSLQYVKEFKEITDSLTILDKHGQGTFASVFTVKDKRNPESEQIYALKMIIPTVDVRRIENEIRILRRLGGKHNIIKMHTALRIKDHVFILMPFVNFIPFADYYLTADESEIRRYLRCLLSALAHIHKYKIIHRDIKPTNFLRDQFSKQFYLVDFGLAHSEEFGDIDSRWERLFEEPQDENTEQNKENAPSSDLDSKTTIQPSRSNPEANPPTHSKSVSRLNLEKQRSISKSSSTSRLSPNNKNQTVTSQNIIPGTCVCGLRVAVCRGCKHLPRAPAGRRGGTLGFRPPEVMMRHIEQTTAVDVWAVGVIFLSFLSGRYPFIRADDDLDVLHAFTHLVGYERMQIAARRLGRRLLLDPRPPLMEATDSPGVWLGTRCAAIRRHEKKFAGLPPLMSGSSKPQTSESSDPPPKTNNIALPATHTFPSSAYDLLARLLEPNPYKRISAYNALRHPYFCSTNQKSSALPTKRPLSETTDHQQQPRSRPRLGFTENSPTFIQRPQFC